MEDQPCRDEHTTNNNANTANFDAEWQQFEAELQGAPSGQVTTDSLAIEYPRYSQPPVNACSDLSAAAEKNVDDDSAAYSPSSEPMLDLFDDNKEVNSELARSPINDTSENSLKPHDQGFKDKSSRARKHTRSRSRSRSKSRSRHSSKKDKHRHRRSRSRGRHRKHRRSSSSRSSSSRSSSDHRHYSRRSRSRDRKHRDDDRRKSDHSSTTSAYGPRSAEQLEKQRQLNAAVLSQKHQQLQRHPGKFPSSRFGNSQPDSLSDEPESGPPPSRPGNDNGLYQQRKKQQLEPRMSAQERAAALQKRVEETTGIQMPKYYNPGAINPLKFAEQMQKRKLLWSKAKEGKTENESLWQNTAMALGGSTSNKFQKLMGIKSEAPSEAASVDPSSSDSKKKQEQLFDSLDREYEFARLATHTHRGMGLGFSSAAASFMSNTAGSTKK